MDERDYMEETENRRLITEGDGAGVDFPDQLLYLKGDDMETDDAGPPALDWLTAPGL